MIFNICFYYNVYKGIIPQQNLFLKVGLGFCVFTNVAKPLKLCYGVYGTEM